MNKYDYTDIIIDFLNKYSKNHCPIQVNFKELTKGVKFHDRASHLIHTYPAKLLPNIPYFFLNNNYFSNEGSLVLDPFCGSGTVLLESILSNRNAIGSDANPLAKLISTVKTREYDIKKLLNKKSRLHNKIYNSIPIIDEFPEINNLNYWFHENVKLQLNTILYYIKKIKDKKTRDFFILCFSNCVKKVSLADQKISVPVKIKGHYLQKTIASIESNKNFTFDKYFEIVNENINKFAKKSELTNNKFSSKIISNDAKKLKNVNSSSIDLVITSPPYAGAQKYIRASSLSIGWTEITNKTIRELDKKNIGREIYASKEYKNFKQTGINDADILLKKIYSINPLRAYIASNYLIEMRKAIKEVIRVLKKDKYFILVAANNKVCGEEFETQDYLRQIAEQEGMITDCRLIDDIKSYGLMTKRNKTASIITCEWVLILRKK